MASRFSSYFYQTRPSTYHRFFFLYIPSSSLLLPLHLILPPPLTLSSTKSTLFYAPSLPTASICAIGSQPPYLLLLPPYIAPLYSLRLFFPFVKKITSNRFKIRAVNRESNGDPVAEKEVISFFHTSIPLKFLSEIETISILIVSKESRRCRPSINSHNPKILNVQKATLRVIRL
ncbi:unnamed protein product [Lactuca saligna]|uniref:Uncharacterized protein n=1 Tax=Lactuca saligna TaxID=75948 RepID=A0AA35ZSC5_LACSI|nr:unnamed protein product [Lactuca saligna]